MEKYRNILYKDESVYVCMSGGLPPDSHKPSPRNLAWAPYFTLARCWLGTETGGRPQMLTPGGTPYSDPI